MFDGSKRFGTYVMDEFEFESGRVLNDVDVEYYTVGNPIYDSDGNIINSIIFCPAVKGAQSLFNEMPINVSRLIMTKKEYFYIIITSLGAPESCSPSTTGLKYNFPNYTFKDRVNFKRKFLKDKFNIVKVHGVVGEGVGGFDVFTWACEYPDEMEFIVVINSSCENSGYKYVVANTVNEMIESSDEYYSEIYSSSLTQTMMAINRLLFAFYLPKRILTGFNNDELEYMMEEYVEDGLFLDVYDFKIRNDCIINYNIKDKLSNIKVKTLVISTYDNVFFIPEVDAIPLKDLIEDCHVLLFKSNKMVYSDLEDFSEMTGPVDDFVRPFIEKILEDSEDYL